MHLLHTNTAFTYVCVQIFLTLCGFCVRIWLCFCACCADFAYVTVFFALWAAFAYGYGFLKPWKPRCSNLGGSLICWKYRWYDLEGSLICWKSWWSNLERSLIYWKSQWSKFEGSLIHWKSVRTLVMFGPSGGSVCRIPYSGFRRVLYPEIFSRFTVRSYLGLFLAVSCWYCRAIYPGGVILLCTMLVL